MIRKFIDFKSGDMVEIIISTGEKFAGKVRKISPVGEENEFAVSIEEEANDYKQIWTIASSAIVAYRICL